MAGASRQREDLGGKLTNESRQITFTDVKGWNGGKEKAEDRLEEGREGVSSYRFISENPLP